MVMSAHMREQFRISGKGNYFASRTLPSARCQARPDTDVGVDEGQSPDDRSERRRASDDRHGDGGRPRAGHRRRAHSIITDELVRSLAIS